ncbi:AAEL009613-PA [Aedes aegypti]|nr:AAEL009613-PA [Aedes aegypti]
MDSPLANQTSKALLLDRSSNQLLVPTVSPMLNPACGFKVKGHLKRRCKDCFFVVRHQRLYVICKTHPRHKQMSMKKRERNTWILTDATQGPARAW